MMRSGAHLPIVSEGRAYSDVMATGRKHRRSAAYLRFDPHGLPCWKCGGAATSRDHRPPLALHEHVEGSGCCVLWPACQSCNSAEGQAISAALRHARGTKRAMRRAVSRREGLMATGPIEPWLT
jgi:hypothetical protein